MKHNTIRNPALKPSDNRCHDSEPNGPLCASRYTTRGKRIATALLLITSAALTDCGGADRPAHPLEGTVNGLLAGSSLVLQNGGRDNLEITRSGGFVFSGSFSPGARYAVTVATQPAGQTCIVSNGSGEIPGPTSVLGIPAAQGVRDVVVNCFEGGGPFTVGGTATGLLSGNSVVLEDNGGNALTVSANTSFIFSAALAAGKSYAVTVLTQPTGQTCAVTNGTGASILDDVTDIAVVCSDDTFRMTSSLSALAANASRSPTILPMR
jgi:hypothetical protein